MGNFHTGNGLIKEKYVLVERQTVKLNRYIVFLLSLSYLRFDL